MKWNLSGDVRLRENESRARDTDDSFIRAATDRGRKVSGSISCNVHADDEKIAVSEFEDVGATAFRSGFSSISMRIGSQASNDSHFLAIRVGIAISSNLYQVTPIWANPSFLSSSAAMDYSPRYGRFRALLRTIREEAGLSQTALAAKLEKPQTFVSKSEVGERRMDFLETADFCEACGVTVAEFVQRLEKASQTNPKPAPKRKSPRKMDAEGRMVSPQKS